MTKNETTSLPNLLAHRDGEPLDLAVAQQIEGDPEARKKLGQLRAIKHALNALPPVAPQIAMDETWLVAQQQAAQQRINGANSAWLPGWLTRYPLATAASVFFAATLSIVTWFPTSPNSSPEVDPMLDVAAETSSVQLAQLMARSQSLEGEVLVPAISYPSGADRAQSALLYRIADIDSELSRVLEEERMDARLRARLWQQRVDLLESLLEVRRSRDAVIASSMY